MTYGIYSIQDTLIGFNAPFIMSNDEVAKREYHNYLNNTPNSEDMRLFYLGTFDDTNGKIENVTPVQVEGGLKK